MNKELIDQSAHLGSNLLLTVLVFVPFLNILVVAFWAITREYYQHKKDAFTFIENAQRINFFNLDLKWSYTGIVAGTLISTGVWSYIIISGVV
jgi:hypothetical protein